MNSIAMGVRDTMAKRKKHRTNQDAPVAPPARKVWWRRVMKILPFGFVVTVVSFVPTLASYNTRLSVGIPAEMASTRPLSFPIWVSNDGIFPVRVKECIYVIPELTTSKGDRLRKLTGHMAPSPDIWLRPGRRCDLLFPVDEANRLAPPDKQLFKPGATIASCDLRIVVRCRTLGWRVTEEVFGFKAILKPDGQVYWSSVPESVRE
jgi:hypothetical protein